MAMGLPTDTRGQILALAILVAAAGGYFFYAKVHQPARERITTDRAQLDSVEDVVQKAKADLASGTVEDLRRKVTEFTATLGLMRQLVPNGNEVPTLIDQISTRAKVRTITIGRIQPISPLPGQPFDTYQYKLEIYGHYDQLGEFLSDMASLPRIIVPQDVQLTPATTAAQKFVGDTLGGLLEASLTIRTYVKSPPPADAAKTGGAGAHN